MSKLLDRFRYFKQKGESVAPATPGISTAPTG